MNCDDKEDLEPVLTSENCDEDEIAVENSDLDLQIDPDETLIPRDSSTPKPSDLSTPEHDIIETIEDEIGKKLSEKAEKSNLTVTNVKTIIKQVLTNEHFRAFLGREDKDLHSYEPKLTRAKAKELLSSNPPAVLPWVPKPPPSETHVLIGEDLKEDDSGDEYVPGEEESEDDRDESFASESDVSSLPPPTPPTPSLVEDSITQSANYTDDGVFKIPPPKTAQEKAAEEAANIALRTRSKINLSSTPLEVIEKNFIPPDITTDMYDMECDDEEWREFLKGFTEPLEEVTKPNEDEEQDPEYNILADDEINHVDNEDFRVDKAVKITKKEVKELWEELFEYLREVSEEYDKDKDQTQNTVVNEDLETSLVDLTQDTNNAVAILAPRSDVPSSSKNEKSTQLLDVTISYENVYLIEQQMRQHVQMLTQNFILSYEHPDFHEYSAKFKEYLLNLKLLSEGKTYSSFRSINLLPACKFVDDWIDLCASNGEDINKCRAHIKEDLSKSVQYKTAGNWSFVVTLPTLMLETMSKSEVFLFPCLLPKIPLKSEEFSCMRRSSFTDGEDSLLAFGIDLFKRFLSNDKKEKQVTMKEIIRNVKVYIMPHRNEHAITQHIMKCKHPRCRKNPIQQYMIHGKLKPIVHTIYPLNEILPPRKRKAEELPYQWKNFLYPVENESISQSQNILNISPVQGVVSQQLIVINSSATAPSSFSSPIILTIPYEVKTPKRRRRQPKARLQKNFDVVDQTPCPSKSNQGSDQRESPVKHTSSASTGSQRISGNLQNILTCIELVVSIFMRPLALQKLIRLLADLEENQQSQTDSLKTKPPNMPSLNTPVKFTENREEKRTEESMVSSTTELIDTHAEHEKPETITSCTVRQEIKKLKNLEFSTIPSGSFQKANSSSEMEFCRNSDDVQICQTSQCDNNAIPSGSASIQPDKDNPEDINALLTASSTITPEVKPVARKEPSGAEKKKNKLRKEFVANLSIATPEDPDIEKHKNEMFAIAYYDKLRQTLDIEDYNRLMQILNDFGSGDVIDLYNDVQTVLRPKYIELAEEFLFFLKEKEANAVGQLIPWLELQARVKFLRKLEIYLKDQPTQLKRIYNTLMEFTTTENLTMEKIKSVLVPLLKGNVILLDLFLQNFRDERPPSSLLEGPYETIDVNKELARPSNDDLYETFVVPNTEDKYGGQNCICHCHKIDDNEYKTRYRHCNACGLKFSNGRLYLSTGRIYQPATVTFKTSPDVNHNARLLGKAATTTSTTQKKKRSDNSPNKATSSGKENLEDETEDEEQGKRKKSTSQKNARKRKKSEPSNQENVNTEETSQDHYKSEDSTSSMEGPKDSQGGNKTDVELSWRREEDTVILETLQRGEDKEFALQIISHKLPNRTVAQIRSRLSRLMDLLIESSKNNSPSLKKPK